MKSLRILLCGVCSGAFVLALSACGGSGGGSPAMQNTPIPTPLPSVSPPNRMYVEYGTASGHALVQYKLPLGAASLPQAILQQDMFVNANPYAVDLSSGTLAIAPSVDNPGDGLRIYRPPLTASQNPNVVIPSGPATLPSGATAAVFDPLGNLWLSTQLDIREFTTPFSSTEVASTIQSNYTFPNLEIDNGGSLYGITTPLNVFAPLDAPVTFAYTKPPKKIAGMVQFVSPLAFDQFGNALAAYQIVATGPTPLPSPFPVPTAGLGVFPLPITQDGLPNLVIPLPGSGQVQPSLDGSIGTDESNLYIGDSTDGSIYAYPLPLSSGFPAFRIACPAQLAPCTLPIANQPNAVFQYGP